VCALGLIAAPVVSATASSLPAPAHGSAATPLSTNDKGRTSGDDAQQKAKEKAKEKAEEKAKAEAAAKAKQKAEEAAERAREAAIEKAKVAAEKKVTDSTHGGSDSRHAAAAPATAAPAAQHSTTHFSAPAQRSATARPAPAATAPVVVDHSDPAPFSPTTLTAARVQPVEPLGALSGISFGGGLLLWPVLVAVNLIALGALTRIVMRRRLGASED
jgi:membrane protein involved in colicin uptake